MATNKGTRKNANGDGSMRKHTVEKNGTEYTYWESRVTVGFDPITGKQVQKTFTGKTQREVREKANQAKYELKQGSYVAPNKMTVGEWMEQWQRDCVDLENGTLCVKQQLQRVNGECHLVPPKNGKSRTLAIAASVVQLFQKQKERQEIQMQELGPVWENCGMVFTNPTGGYLSYRTVYDCFKRLVTKIGAPEARVHDLRHTYAVLSIQSGDDIKTVQGNLGHATAAFTLDVYGHVSERMKKKSADRLYQVSLKSRHWKWLLFIARKGVETCMRRLLCHLWQSGRRLPIS